MLFPRHLHLQQLKQTQVRLRPLRSFFKSRCPLVLLPLLQLLPQPQLLPLPLPQLLLLLLVLQRQ